MTNAQPGVFMIVRFKSTLVAAELERRYEKRMPLAFTTGSCRPRRRA